MNAQDTLHIFQSNDIDKSRVKRLFEIIHCQFEGRADVHNRIRPDQMNWYNQLASCTIFKKKSCMVNLFNFLFNKPIITKQIYST